MMSSRTLKQTLLLACLATAVVYYSANAESIEVNRAMPTPVNALKLVGEGKLTVWLWDIYRLKLYSDSGSYAPGEKPVALEFTYLRDFSSEDLVGETAKQWRKLKLDVHPDEQIWLRTLSGIWPDIQENEVLVLHVDESGISHFYHQKSYIGLVESTEFSERFLAIWLSENTSAPKVRRQLINEQ